MTRPRLHSKITPTQQLELWAWYQAKVALGTFKTKAKELGVAPSTISEFVSRKKASIRREYERRRRAVNGSRMGAWGMMR